MPQPFNNILWHFFLRKGDNKKKEKRGQLPSDTNILIYEYETIIKK
jgi:hypothetical protein